MTEAPSHFDGKEAIEHVIQAQAEGIISSSEIHGTEIPGNLSAGSDASRETALFLSLIWLLLLSIPTPPQKMPLLLGIVSLGLLFWKTGRSAWLAWFRLERLHRILEQERWEIEHHRQQERDELGALYTAKGFEGKLLEDVLDVLMADNDRLLKIMVEEELGLSLAVYQHPLKQALGAAIGVLIGALACILSFMLWPKYGLLLGGTIVIASSASLSASLSQNKVIPSIVWNLSLAMLACSSVYVLLFT